MNIIPKTSIPNAHRSKNEWRDTYLIVFIKLQPLYDFILGIDCL